MRGESGQRDVQWTATKYKVDPPNQKWTPPHFCQTIVGSGPPCVCEIAICHHSEREKQRKVEISTIPMLIAHLPPTQAVFATE